MLSNIYTRCAVAAVVLVMITACGVKKSGTPAEFADLTSLMNNGETIRIEMNAAYPLNTFASQQVINQIMRNTGDTANRIDLTGDGAFLEFSADTVSADLPFFGERRQGGGYNNSQDSGIFFEQAPEDYQFAANESDLQYDVDFEANNKTENFDVNVVVFANGSATVYVRSSARTVIRYDGRVVSNSDTE